MDIFGIIVAFDTPFNLKKQYTSTIMKFETDEPVKITNFLENHALKYKIEGD